jgi:hypothetical protein
MEERAEEFRTDLGVGIDESLDSRLMEFNDKLLIKLENLCGSKNTSQTKINILDTTTMCYGESTVSKG